MATDVLIRVEGLRKSFGTAIHALNGVDAEIHRGEVVVVIGPSGSGKSTFLRCLNLMEMPTGGRITFEGVDITDPKVNGRIVAGKTFESTRELKLHEVLKEDL